MYRCLNLAAAFFAASLLPAGAFDTEAEAAWVYDATTHTVLMDKNGEEALPPASMSKLMTINMVFEALRDGRITLETRFPVSDRAVEMTRKGGSTMMLQHTDRPTIEELLRGIIVNSGNDACVVVAEGLAGSEAAFADQMTERARALGLMSSTFANASGWPDPRQRMSMRDLGILSVRLIEEFPEYYPMFAETEFSYQGRSPDNRFNRNPLLKLGIGADGLKTGHTKESGYGLVGSAVQGDRRLILAMTGLPSDGTRSEEAERILAWGFHQFTVKTVASPATRVASAEVFMGEKDVIGLVPEKEISLLVPALVQDQIKATVSYEGPLPAPLAQGEKVAELIIEVPGLPVRRVPLVAEKDVKEAGFFRRLMSTAGFLWHKHVLNDGAANA